MPIRPASMMILLVFIGCAGCQSPLQVSFRKDVYPILEANCVDCHTPPVGKGYRETGLNMENYESIMKGTVYGPVIVPGDSRRSILNMLVEGRADASLRMPHNEDKPLTASELRILHQWVKQGARDN